MGVDEGEEILTMVSVLLTSRKGLGLLRELPNPISGPRRAMRRPFHLQAAGKVT